MYVGMINLHLEVTSYISLSQAPSTEIAVSELTHASAEVSEIVFFLLGAMTIVEIIDAHQGFKLVTDNITTRKPRILLWVVSVIFLVIFTYYIIILHSGIAIKHVRCYIFFVVFYQDICNWSHSLFVVNTMSTMLKMVIGYCQVHLFFFAKSKFLL